MSKSKVKKKRIGKKIIAYLLLILCLLYLVWMLYITQYATDSNTYKTNVSFTESNTIGWGHTDYLYLNDDTYMMFFGSNKNPESVKVLGEDLVSASGEVEITVWERYPRWFIDAVKSDNLKVKQIVDIRDNTTVYYDISEHNSFQHSERVSGLIMFVFVFIIALGWMIFLLDKLRELLFDFVANSKTKK